MLIGLIYKEPEDIMDRIDEFLPYVDNWATCDSGEYYINMAVAWYYSFALIKQYDSAIKVIESRRLDPWVHNKSIQKAIESYRVPDDRKDYLRTLRIKRSSKERR